MKRFIGSHKLIILVTTLIVCGGLPWILLIPSWAAIEMLTEPKNAKLKSPEPLNPGTEARVQVGGDAPREGSISVSFRRLN